MENNKKLFDRNGFMDYLSNTFYGFDNSMFRGTVENIIEYGLEHYGCSDNFAYFISGIIEEVTHDDIIPFMADSTLTAHGKEIKENFWAENRYEQYGYFKEEY